MYLQPDWKGLPPNGEAIQQMWRVTAFAEVPTRLDKHLLLKRYAELFRAESPIFLQVQGPSHPVFSWFASRNRLPEMGFFSKFLRCPAIASQAPQLQLSSPLEAEPVFEVVSGFCLGGMFAADLFWGGAQMDFKSAATTAKELGESFCNELIGNRFDEAIAYRTTDSWSPWFNEYGSDVTYIVLDRRAAIFSLLCLTDCA